MRFFEYLFPGFVIGPIITAFLSGFGAGGVLLYDDNLSVFQLMSSGLLIAGVMWFIDSKILSK